MSAPNTPDPGNFGLSCAKLVIRPGMSKDDLGTDALCLLNQALAVFEAVSDSDCFRGDGGAEPHELHFGGLYLLRQARIVLSTMLMGHLAVIQQDADERRAAS